MSKATKRKHVQKEMLDTEWNGPTDKQRIVRIVAGRGNNLHEVFSVEDNETFLVSMPVKFRRNVWVKRNDYVVVEPITEGDRVRGEIVRVLNKEDLKLMKQKGWAGKKEENEILPNTNRPVVTTISDLSGTDTDTDHDDPSEDTD
ncbi:Translation initiation factor 1A (eIF-1A),Nucleic acid-binding, OB-fold,RNA-binding domain, S1 [Cinara cedri]|uniref:Probable RNA-binding protein EIF1AD n=1 Tax=Cinara cedri TaxID=506608 RepID=A0A5E4MN96_9HEMI|nr:Translation initiation factor 1A (eIF-1A),Nucleic acid-binding, OB-fold,RNA-binding domain, S1 [Cinara cedri]